MEEAVVEARVKEGKVEEGVGKENRPEPTSVINFEMCMEKR